MINRCILPQPSDWFYSFRAQIELLRPFPPPLPLVQTPAPTPLKTPPSPHRLFDSQDTLDKLMHFLPQLSDFVPVKNGFYSSRAQTD